MEVDNKLPKVWHENVEANLVELISGYRSLWRIKDETDITEQGMEDVRKIRDALNVHFASGFTEDKVIKKWLEIRQLFDIKFAMNGYTMEDRGHHIRRDGSLKDDLNESWRLFKKLDFLVEPTTNEVETEEKMEF